MSKFKGTRIAILVVLALVMSVIGAGAAGGPPGAGFYSGQTVQNLGPATDVMVTLYDMNNAANQPSRTWSVPEGGAFTFFLSDIPGTTAGFVGSAVVSSEQEVKAVVNVTNRKSGDFGIDGGTAAAQYRGISDASTGTTLVFPLAKAAFGPKTTAFYIQNAGTANAVFTAKFLMGPNLDGSGATEYTYVLPAALVPGQMAVIFPGDAGVPNASIGSLTVTSDQKLAGAMLEYETTTNPAKILQSTTGFTDNDFDTAVLFPVVKKQLSGRSTGLQVQNVGNAAVDVTMTYRGAGGSCPAPFSATEPVRTLQPKQSTTYLDSALLPAGCLASAEATATGNIAGVVNEAFLPCTGACVQRSTTYAAFPAKNATAKLVAPVFKEDFGGKRSGMTIQNVSNTDTVATVVFKTNTATYTLNNLAIPAKQSKTLLDMTNTTAWPTANWAGGMGLPDGSLAAVTVTANQAIIAIVNEAPLAGVVQDNINYEAFNVAP